MITERFKLKFARFLLVIVMLITVNQTFAETNDSTIIKKYLSLALENYLSYPDSNLYYSEKARILANKSGYYREEGIANFYLANYYTFDVAEYSNALNNCNSAVELFKQIGDSVLLSKVINQIGIIYYYLGQYEKSIDFYQQSLKINETIKDSSSSANALGNIGMVYTKMGDNIEALKYYKKTINLMKHLGNKNYANMLNNIGVLYMDMDSMEQAIFHYKTSYELAISQNDKPLIAYTLDNIGNVFHRKNMNDSALYYSNKALEIREELGNIEGIILSKVNVSSSFQELKQYGKAFELLNSALLLSKEAGLLSHQKDIHIKLSELYEITDNHYKSLDHFKIYTQLKDSLFNESKSKEIGKLEAQYEFEKQQEEEKRKDEIRNQKIENERQRKNNLQYSGIFVVVLLLFALVFMTGKFSISERIAEGLIFFTFLLFFEFLLVLLDPTIEQWSGGEPAYKLILNAILAATIFPLHAFFENNLKNKLMK